MKREGEEGGGEEAEEEDHRQGLCPGLLFLLSPLL
jgi:hypothetical protein